MKLKYWAIVGLLGFTAIPAFADGAAMDLSCDSNYPEIHLKAVKKGESFNDVTVNGEALEAPVVRAKVIKRELSIEGESVRIFEVPVRQGTLKFLVLAEDKPYIWGQEARIRDVDSESQTVRLECVMSAQPAVDAQPEADKDSN